LLILGITALALSRVTFSLFNDPEGPNLLIVVGLALILYLLSLTAYAFNSSITGLKRLVLAISIQALFAAGFYLFLS
jgi:hypothetical protein